ncbi:sensor histidine kinase [Haloparvum sp. AD34]
MSQQVDGLSDGGDYGPGSGLEALRRSSAFQGPVEPLDGHDHAHDHFALVHEDREEQFDCVVPFVRQGLDETAHEYVDFAVDGAERMREMVDDLLAYSRVEQSEGELERVDTGAVLDRTRDDLQARIEKTDATVSAESLPTVRADRDQLEQLFRNLVSNGIKYNEADPAVEVDARKRAQCWEFTVADDGIGIDPGRADRIFEVFKRLHHDDEYTGTGIGLSLCQEIVENHGGDIWVESEPGTGSTFHFTLPRSDAQ